jgi:sulfur-carrier protein
VPVTVKIPPQLRAATGGEGAPKVEGSTVGEVLDALYARHGELRERIAGDDGAIRRFVNVFLDGEDIRFLDDLETSVPEGAELTILPAVAGG